MYGPRRAAMCCSGRTAEQVVVGDDDQRVDGLPQRFHCLRCLRAHVHPLVPNHELCARRCCAQACTSLRYGPPPALPAMQVLLNSIFWKIQVGLSVEYWKIGSACGLVSLGSF